MRLTLPTGQVVALFIVGAGEYLTVWLATDWDKEVERGMARNLLEAKRRETIVARQD